MINKREKPKRKFSPVSISESLSSVNRKFLYKFGKLDFIIHAKWSEIVGDFFVQHSEPNKITSIAGDTNESGETVYDRYLHIDVSPAAAIEFQHFQDKIIEKINSYFGYKAIKGLKIRQHYFKKNYLDNRKKSTNLINNEINELEIREVTPKLINKELEESIVKLGLSITNEEE